MVNQEIEQILTERFGKDTLIALATEEAGIPYVRNVNAYYEQGTFYIITYGLSNKMRQLAKNPKAAIAGEWFTAHGTAFNLGYFGKAENVRLAQKLKVVFSSWIDNGHNDFSDENTCILAVKLTKGVLFSMGKRFEFDAQ